MTIYQIFMIIGLAIVVAFFMGGITAGIVLFVLDIRYEIGRCRERRVLYNQWLKSLDPEEREEIKTLGYPLITHGSRNKHINSAGWSYGETEHLKPKKQPAEHQPKRKKRKPKSWSICVEYNFTMGSTKKWGPSIAQICEYLEEQIECNSMNPDDFIFESADPEDSLG